MYALEGGLAAAGGGNSVNGMTCGGSGIHPPPLALCIPIGFVFAFIKLRCVKKFVFFFFQNSGLLLMADENGSSTNEQQLPFFYGI